MFVRSKTSKDPTVGVRTDLFGRFYFQVLPLLDRLYGKRLKTDDGLQRSFNPASTLSLRRYVRPAEYDVVMLHFLGQGFLSCREIGRLPGPVVWLLHDMWPFSGAEHYTDDQTRLSDGYTRRNRPANQRGPDLDRRLWEAKRKHWNVANMTVLGASRWISDLARHSRLLSAARHGVMPYPLDLRIFQPQDKAAARRLFGLPPERKLVLFGAVGALKDRRKGFDLLTEGLARLKVPVDLVVFGNRPDDRFDDLSVPYHAVGMLADEYSLAMLYSAADVMAVPSRIDNLPQTVLESLACGTPCVAFNVGGMPDMIRHRENGYLASPYSADELAAGIEWAIEDQSTGGRASIRAREHVAAMCDEAEIGRKYIELFQSLRRTR